MEPDVTEMAHAIARVRSARYAIPIGPDRAQFDADVQLLADARRQAVEEADTLERALASVLNRHSAENASNTPDFILAQYLIACLGAWNTAVQQRETWYGRDARPLSQGTSPLPPEPWSGEETQRDIDSSMRRSMDGGRGEGRG